MAQVRRQTRNPSPPPRQIPSLPGAIRFRPPSSTNIRQSESFQVNNRPPYAGSPLRATHQRQIVTIILHLVKLAYPITVQIM